MGVSTIRAQFSSAGRRVSSCNVTARTYGRMIVTMPTPSTEYRILFPPRLLLAMLAWLFWPTVTQAVEYGNEVAVWIEQGKAVAHVFERDAEFLLALPDFV